ncbi:ABC transporter ATP-binding protein [Polaromonas sp. AER18D-145]|uniref:ABC transporter ATP-binding protein n=1 Tax=Polaromonas sp. AER18D-145 TaxID=1977060 RepID=UPI000BBC9C3A|nr:ABC transporter ATP-binding protein [Polaromonas sp. AER18D-145]
MSTDTQAFLDMRRVSYSFPAYPQVVNQVDWQIARGEVHSLVGRSGCGKTTLLKLAAGLLLPDAGTVTVDGQALRKPGSQLGFVFQAPTLLEWKTVLDNVLLPVTLQRKPLPADRARADELLALMGLSGLGRRFPTELSGGQQSRVAIARALLLAPSLLLLDEPFAALDAITREELQDDFLRICRLAQTTVFFVTHDISEAVYLADRVAVMADGKITDDLAVNLPWPRGRELRYGAPFNAVCAQVRRAMDGGVTC